MERASGSDGILNFKSPEGFKSEIEPWPFPSRRLSGSLIGLVLWSWERVGKALSSLGFIADVLATNIKCASNNFTSRFTIEARKDSSILCVPRHYKRGRSYVLITISTAGDTSKFSRVSILLRYRSNKNINIIKITLLKLLKLNVRYCWRFSSFSSRGAGNFAVGLRKNGDPYEITWPIFSWWSKTFPRHRDDACVTMKVTWRWRKSSNFPYLVHRPLTFMRLRARAREYSTRLPPVHPRECTPEIFQAKCPGVIRGAAHAIDHGVFSIHIHTRDCARVRLQTYPQIHARKRADWVIFWSLPRVLRAKPAYGLVHCVQIRIEKRYTHTAVLNIL